MHSQFTWKWHLLENSAFHFLNGVKYCMHYTWFLVYYYTHFIDFCFWSPTWSDMWLPDRLILTILFTVTSEQLPNILHVFSKNNNSKWIWMKVPDAKIFWDYHCIPLFLGAVFWNSHFTEQKSREWKIEMKQWC